MRHLGLGLCDRVHLFKYFSLSSFKSIGGPTLTSSFPASLSARGWLGTIPSDLNFCARSSTRIWKSDNSRFRNERKSALSPCRALLRHARKCGHGASLTDRQRGCASHNSSASLLLRSAPDHSANSRLTLSAAFNSRVYPCLKTLRPYHPPH